MKSSFYLKLFIYKSNFILDENLIGNCKYIETQGKVGNDMLTIIVELPYKEYHINCGEMNFLLHPLK